MGHNYSKHFNSNHEHTQELNPLLEAEQVENNVEEVVEENIIPEVVEEQNVESTVAITQSATGVVSGCELLNVRKENNKGSEIIGIISADTEVEVDLSVDTSTEEFYKVIVIPSGLEGYCMKKFINLK